MKKVVWVSRHEMTKEQKADLERLLGEKVNVRHAPDVVFAATGDVAEDAKRNAITVNVVISDADVIAGVFPPVFFECLFIFGGQALTDYRPVYSAVSAQKAEERTDGKAIQFRHVRWARVV